MKPATQNGLLAAAIVAGLLSLPTVWMTIRNTDIQIRPTFGGQLLSPNSDFSKLIVPNVTNTHFDVTGLNGHVTLVVKLPIWLVVVFAMVTCLFLLLDNSRSLSFPRGMLWSLCILSLVFTTLPLVLGLASGRASPGIGWLLGLFCAATPLVVLWSCKERGRARKGERGLFAEGDASL